MWCRLAQEAPANVVKERSFTVPRTAAARDLALTVSVIIPALNEERRIAACLAALARQTVPAHEIILVDNGSTDRTVEIARAAGARIVHEPKRSIAAARATGFDAAEGAILARIDADTAVDPDWVSGLQQVFAADPRTDAVAGVATEVRLPHWMAPIGYLGYRVFRAYNRLTAGSGPLLYGHNMALRRETWERIRGIVSRDDAEVTEDIDVALAIRLIGGRVRLSGRVRASIDIVRSMRPSKQAEYLRSDQRTRRKYERLTAERRRAEHTDASVTSQQ